MAVIVKCSLRLLYTLPLIIKIKIYTFAKNVLYYQYHQSSLVCIIVPLLFLLSLLLFNHDLLAFVISTQYNMLTICSTTRSKTCMSESEHTQKYSSIAKLPYSYRSNSFFNRHKIKRKANDWILSSYYYCCVTNWPFQLLITCWLFIKVGRWREACKYIHSFDSFI